LPATLQAHAAAGDVHRQPAVDAGDAHGLVGIAQVEPRLGGAYRAFAGLDPERLCDMGEHFDFAFEQFNPAPLG
jgi:hypothetical protein